MQQQQQHDAGDGTQPLLVAAAPAAVSPEPPSPLSMDLTNNILDYQRAQAEQQLAAKGAAPLELVPQQQQELVYDYTRNITGNIPALSTLVEEDEEAGGLDVINRGILPCMCGTIRPT